MAIHSFKWTKSRNARVAAAVRAYNAAITRRAKELIAQGRADLVGRLPEKTTVAEVKSRIYSTNDYRRIVGYKSDIKRRRFSELTRILKSADPKALEFTDKGGILETNYSRREYRYNRQSIKRRSKWLKDVMGEKFFKDDVSYNFDEMSAPEYAAAVNNNELVGEDEGEVDETVEDVDKETIEKWRREDAKVKRESVTPSAMAMFYLKTWKDPIWHHADMPGYQDMVDAIEWMAEHRPDALNKLFASDRDEVDPVYIMESDTDRNPYANISYETRHDRAVRCVTEYARKVGWRSWKDEYRQSSRDDKVGELAHKGYRYFI